MGCNVGGLDRGLRILGGIIILLIGAGMSSWWALIGLIPLLSGLFKRCPIYNLFGFNSCKVESDNT